MLLLPKVARASLLRTKHMVALTDPFWSQARGVITLKRKYRIPQDQIKHPTLKLHRPRLRTYELVEDTESLPKKPLKLVLKEFVEGVGYAGDVVEIEMTWDSKPRYELLLTGLAEYATPENLEWARQYREKMDVKRFSSLFSPRIIRLLRDTLFPLDMSPKNPWTVEKWHVRSALRAAGVNLPEAAITLPEEPIVGPDNAFNKDFVVQIMINGQDEAHCRLRIRSAEEGLSPAALFEESEVPWFMEEPIPYLESQRKNIEELHQAAAKAYERELQKLREAGHGI
ncbi:39S ribosomal protein L9, mitochondrial-like [Varroa jacobsoni]|uniref:39S ribosomal protein L9, mitochondrial-like n=1 Tax=Varroa jacobsoni TaxID=62625 RepID=UPI000BF38B33|nr:39S ribosomal protein L9, mitochondrial-like [Varroa jacobsoni]